MAALKPAPNPTSPAGQILAADIGGTHARFLLAPVAHGGAALPGTRVELASRGSADIEDLVAAALRRFELQPPVHIDAMFAVAGPVRDGRADMTNLSWHADAASLRRRFGFGHVDFVNDLEAAARALAEQPPADAALLRGGQSAGDRSVVISVGTGLGVAYWSGAGRELRVEASEAGHLGYAPTETWELELLKLLQQRHGEHVSWERILSGPGLASLDAFGRHGEPTTPAEVAHRAASGNTPALMALKRFSRLLGVFAGDLAVAAPAANVWLAGGVLAGLGPLFDIRAFLEGFDAKGRVAPLIQATPVRWTDDGELGLRGAWLAAHHPAYRRELWASP